MLKYTIQRLLFMLLTLFVIIGMCFILIRMLPPAQLDPTDIHKEAMAVASRTAVGSIPASARMLGLTARM